MKAKLFATASALAFASSLLWALSAEAQTVSAVTVSSCGTPNNTPVVGISYPMTQDTSAKLCTSAVLTGNVTATNPSVGVTGAAVPGNATAVGFSNAGGNLTIPSATNPFPVTGNLSATLPANSTVVVTSGNIAVTSMPANITANITAPTDGSGYVEVDIKAGNVTATVGNVSLGNSTSNIGNVVVSSGNIAINGPIGTGAASVGVTVTLDSTDAAALQEILGNVSSAIPAGTNVIGALVANQTVAVTSMPANITANVTNTVTTNNTPQGQFNYPNRANWVGNTTTIANTTATTVIPSPGTGNSTFVTDYNCSNTGAANVTVTFNDNAGTVLILPAVSGNNLDLTTPREVAGNTALTMTLSANTTSAVCTVSGYKAVT